MTSPRPVPIFDGHNDVLLRLYRRGGTDVHHAFLEGETKGQLDLPMARQGGFVGGLFAIFVPSSDGQNGPNGETASQRVSSGALSAAAVELAPAQRAVLSMVSLLLRIERESKGHVWTAPAVQEESDLSANRSGAAMYAACFSRRGSPRRDAAAVAAGPDVIR